MRDNLSTAVQRVLHFEKGGNMDYYTSFLLHHVDVMLECMSNALREAEKATTPIDKEWWEQEYILHRFALCKLVGNIKADKIFHR